MGMGVGRQRREGIVDTRIRKLLLDANQNWVDDLWSDFIL
jgi:hypothetical protein